MGLGKDEWEKAQEEEEDRKAARSVIEAAEKVRRRVGEQELQRINRRRQAGFWMIGLGLLGAGLMLFNLLWHLGKSWVSRVRPSVAIEPSPEGRIALFGVGLGVGVALLVVGAAVVRLMERRLRRAAGSEEEAEAALMYLSLGSETWEKAAGEAEEEAGEVATAAGPPRVAPGPMERDAWEHRHWLLVEVSGAHLIWWLSFLATILYTLSPYWLLFRETPSPGDFDAMMSRLPPDWLINGLFAIAGVGAVLKVMVPLIWLGAWDASGRSPATGRQLRRYYRFWAKGLLPAALALAPAFVYWGAHSLLWR